jgi:hypothetical protein
MPISKINTTSITDNSVTAGKIVAGAVDADIAAGSIDTAQIADDAVTADKLANAINTSIAAKSPTASPVFTGKVGIGSSSPVRQLEIKDDGTLGQAIVGIIADAGDPAGVFMGTTSNNNVGGIRYFTDTDKLALRAGDEDRLIMDSVGRVTKSGQPCFSATASTTNIPLTTSTTVTLSSERFDVGNNLTNNIFTAPITGKYLFTYIFYISNLDAGHTTFDAHILTSNKQYQQTFKPSVFMNSDGNFGVSGSVIADMDINDTCRFNVYVSGGAAQTDIHADSHVSGCLLF